MSKILLAGTIVVLSITAATELPPLPISKVTVKVLDEERKPVANAVVNFAFVEAHPKWGAAVGIAVHALTNELGLASGSGYSGTSIGCGVRKNGYYIGGPSKIEFHDTILGKWQPWNPTYTVVLKKIINPIPMYAKNVRAIVPVLDKPIGFDLSAGDWVQPFGNGTTSDFVFTMSHTLTDSMNFSAKLTLTFSNKGDGLQIIIRNSEEDQGESQLKFPRNAPGDGYTIENWTTGLDRMPGKFTEQPPEGGGYFIRVRTIQTDKGEVKMADYGKIDGSISIVGAATNHPGITFTYYFNPTGTTNLEFDPTKNLLKNLKDDEQVQIP